MCNGRLDTLREISIVSIVEKGFPEIGVCQRNSAIQACVCVYQSIQRINLAPVWCIDQLPIGHREVYWSETLPNPDGSIETSLSGSVQGQFGVYVFWNFFSSTHFTAAA